MSHVEIPIKVNAWVDEGIAPVVRALNQLPRIVTLDSCEGHDGPGYVYFSSQGGTADLLETCQRLSSYFGEKSPADNEYCLRVEWMAGSEEPMAILSVRLDFVQPLADNVTAFAVSCDRKTL